MALSELDALALDASERASHTRMEAVPSSCAESRRTIRVRPPSHRAADSQQPPFVPNDLRLDSRPLHVDASPEPNMGGKSTYRRQAALIVLLAHIGKLCFQPDRAAIGPLDRIFTAHRLPPDDLAQAAAPPSWWK